MADPFSVAGSAVGMVSLGITICQGLATYYGQFKSFHGEVDDITCRVENLHTVLKLLLKTLTNPVVSGTFSKSECTTVAIDAILRCWQRLQKLEKTLEQCRTSPSGNTLKSKFQINRLLYPFRRETMMALVEIISGLQANLDTALYMLNLDLGIENEKQMSIVVSNSASTAADTGQVLDLVRGLDQKHTDFDRKLVMIENRMIQMESSIIRPRNQPILEPSLLRSLVENQQKIEEHMRDLAIMDRDHFDKCQTGCACSAFGTPSNSTRVAKHPATLPKPGWPFPTGDKYFPSKRIVSICARRVLYNRILKFSIVASLNITRGAGGFAISPNLAFFPVVPEDSPVFSLLMHTEKTLGKGYDDVVLQDTLKGLLKLFRTHESTPLDTLPNGTTILHFVSRWHSFAARWDNPSLLGWRAFLSNLLRTGLPTNTINDCGETPVDALLQSFIGFRGGSGEETTIRICSDLFDRGGYMTPMGSTSILKLNRPGSLSFDFGAYEKSPIVPVIQQIAYQRDLEGGVDIPEELEPLIYRSENLLKALLKEGIDLQWTLNYYTQWPKGLAVLLEAGYVPTRITFVVAVNAGCSESVKLLTQTRGVWLEESNLIDISDEANEEITSLVVQEFVNCRKRLQALAESFLSRTELDRLKVQPGRLLGYQAAETYRALKKQSIEIDYTETPTGWLVYNSVCGDLELAARLWDAGFREVDEVDDNGETCLMQLMWGGSWRRDLVRALKKAEWLVSKGADIHRRKGDSSALHYLAYFIGSELYFETQETDITSILGQLSEGSKRLWRSALLDDTRDACCCVYSAGGCVGLIRFLDGFFPDPRYNSLKAPSQGSAKFAKVLGEIACILEPDLPERLYHKLAHGIIRFLTCRYLEITHTCVCNRYREVRPEDVDEIMDEQKDQVLEVAQLVEEFLLKYEELSMPLPEFLTSYWCTRMEDVLSACEPPTQEQMSQLREIGVVIDG